MALITYPDKITGDTFTGAEATEIKNVVNSNHNGVMAAIDAAVEDALDSGAIADALAEKAPIASPTFTGTVSGITKSMVGLGSVDNTSDAGKPVSTAQQTALDLKANIASPTFTGTVSGITKSMVGLGSVDNTADTAKPVSTAQQTALNLKANLASPALTGTPTAPTAAVATDTEQVATTAFVHDVIEDTTVYFSDSFTGTGTEGDPIDVVISPSSIQENIIPTGTINGSNTVFTFPNTPAAGTLKLYADGLRMIGGGVDFTLVGAVVTFGIAPVSAVIGDYRI